MLVHNLYMWSKCDKMFKKKILNTLRTDNKVIPLTKKKFFTLKYLVYFWKVLKIYSMHCSKIMFQVNTVTFFFAWIISPGRTLHHIPQELGHYAHEISLLQQG